MNKLTTDPLMGSARILLVILIGLTILGMALLAIVAGALPTVLREQAIISLTEVGAPASAIWALVAAVVMLVGLLFLAYRFFRELYAIVATVNEGDPFQPENGNRLAKMGWLALAAQILGVPIMIIGGWFSQFTPEDGSVDLNVGISGGGILLVLTLFILARVFRKGAEMREELEGVV
ncbi:hypothetical protein GCM10009127_08140 [Alteraurantiacibacter aestuarii]|uniref:DUF2975 domain-containing protein n=1 Tax=Alteraurantiacibacter aestuarii TaxID=650004 RepID=A0A844ZJY0_9SPHN|nr:DUF2975 domain-containing protein [Alteraurantiacibacter aestuarii]MXO87207.1 DUF2975 domain-containing protein [Alteraurantiacibacter aestuarii]